MEQNKAKLNQQKQQLSLQLEPVVDIKTFTESPQYLNQPRLSERQAKVLIEFLASDNHTELVLLWGKGSGKDHLAGIIVLYMVYRTLNLSDPQAHYGLAPGSPIDFVNVAQSKPQAERVFFEGSLKAKLNNSPWFKAVGFETTADMIRFPNCIRAISAHSQNESYEGYNILGFVMDEAAAFRSETKIANADKIYNTLRTSMVSRFGNRGRGCILSYPRHEDDFIMRKYAEKDRCKWILADRGATWEINPLRKRSDFDEEYARDPVDAACKYECLPPAVQGAFIPKIHITACATGINHDIASLSPDHRYIISLDPAFHRDRFAVAVGHLDNSTVVVDRVQYWIGTPEKPVLISTVETELLPFAQTRHAQVITDPYQMTATMQNWRNQGITVEEIPVGTKDQMQSWTQLKNAISSQTVVFPNDADLLRELSRLQIKRSGEFWKVEAMSDEYDDLSDAVCRLVGFLRSTSPSSRPEDVYAG